MDNENTFNTTEKIMACDNCGLPTVQQDIDENEGNCLNCNEVFQPYGNSSK